jgi:nucleoid-associated protein YgaU
MVVIVRCVSKRNAQEKEKTNMTPETNKVTDATAIAPATKGKAKAAPAKKAAPATKGKAKAAPAKKAAPATKGKAKAAPATDATPRLNRKQEALGMLRQGCTLEELMEMPGRTPWQRHSVRGFISVLGKEHNIVSTLTEDGFRHYKLAKSKGGK